MSKTLFRFLLISLFLLPLFVSIVFSGCGQSKTATPAFISSFQGDAQIKKVGVTDWTRAEVNSSLEAGDSVKAGAGASISITFFDGSIIELKSDTQIEINELVKGKTTSILLKQEIGETLSKVNKLADSASRYEIETPAAVAGVRGSQMIVKVSINGATAVQNVEGKISVTAQGVEVAIPEGNTSTVIPGETPGTPTPSDVHIVTDGSGDLFDLYGITVSGYQYLDIVNEWIERNGEYWVITIELSGDYPDTVAASSVVEWDVMVDADNNINTGWQSSVLFNDLGIDYYLSLNRIGTDFSLDAQRTSDSNNTYPHTMGYNASGNRLSIRFKPDAIENSSSFSYMVLARQYSIIGDPSSLVAADKIPNSNHFMISTGSP